MSKAEWENNEEIKIFREYLRIPTVHPNIDYTDCVAFLKRQAASLDLLVDVEYPVNKDNPVVIMKWLGKQPKLPGIVLNSHTDVVPVFPEKWSHDPFSADMDDEGRIYARGTQDMKCVGAQYLAAIRALKAKGYQPKRTIYVTFVPDEEVGGYCGMREFIKGDYFKSLNIGLSLDEGSSSLDDGYYVYYAERTAWHIRFKFSGTAGHGSILLPNTAGEKLHFVVNKMMTFRETQVQKLKNDKSLFFGDVTTVNLTRLSGGVQSNVVPSMLEVVFDLRIAIDVDLVAFEQQIRDWCEQAGGGIEIIFEQKDEYVPPTKVDASNPYWLAFEKALNELNLKFRAHVCPGGTDSRFLRSVGIPALGFSPMNNTPILLHDHDEYIRANTYLHGIEVYTKLIAAVADV
ncbi:aminoacylase-1 [Drosophila grimshawi]|uniref:N-acyl-aliphatic-L-amino acid amidohydrolase n=1 Tax=Drosophila grimshawi TaxID=7222 RepID=B4JTG1_DROGR|nr:aminoacylase-1 [Drosophila grimshawi]EDV95051.1 GH23872 [Drosophila grimshawi]